MSIAFVERLVLPCRDIGRSLSVYRDVLGFVATERADGSVDLDQVGADGGGIRLVAEPGGPVLKASLACEGPYGMTIYTTRFDAVLEALGAAVGAEPIAISYTFPGTETLVREGTVPGPDGINIFMVEYDPSRHRCCIDETSEAYVSEIIAVGFVVADVEASLVEHHAALGAKTYMNQIFDGAAVERMNGLAPGSKLHVAFLKGVTPGNAKLELLERIGTVAEGRGQVTGVRVVCRVPETVELAPISLVPGGTLERVRV